VAARLGFSNLGIFGGVGGKNEALKQKHFRSSERGGFSITKPDREGLRG